jgi:homoserine kinase
MAVSGPGDRVVAERVSLPGIVITDPGHADLPTDAARNTAGIAAREVLRRAGANAVGVSLSITKGLPLCGGQGGSAASAVAGAVAVNRLLQSPLDAMALLACALEAEATVSGRHADNVAPALLGGICLVRSADPPDIVSLPVPSSLHIVLALPAQRLSTAEARDVLPRYIERHRVIAQMANVGAMVAAFASGDLALLGRSLDDQIAEPPRAPLLRGFEEAKAAALAVGALGGSISGAGPTSFFFAADLAGAEMIAAAVQAAYVAKGVGCTTRLARVAGQGALTLPEDAQTA